MDVNEVWSPRACTLPTAQRPLRVAEFDALFAEAATGVERVGTGRTRIRLRPGPAAAERAAGLAARETACCSFFTFTLTATGGELALDVAVPGPHTDVLDAFTGRAAAALAAAARPGGGPGE
ncbi:hypothetical protein E1200_18285 [Actinomadura sp. GC306]|uniref:hypothetical protein n=1 Tax=Actinomadura sp. GC306 TaxID=2530367 RepID=UPI00105108E9|nr:hypothetical protein [Actinomadura sp. GC306]TDC65468.1 hypothetical protein E1200_18285 [Actinomadura sp. GC306]